MSLLRSHKYTLSDHRSFSNHEALVRLIGMYRLLSVGSRVGMTGSGKGKEEVLAGSLLYNWGRNE